ncbi:MAG: efflux RND transporter periplasmic adaptor subunit [Alphaproteobacteria bacterium]
MLQRVAQMMRWLIAIVVLAVGAAGSWYVYESQLAPAASPAVAGAEEMPPVVVQTTAATTTTVTETLITFGAIEAARKLTIVAQSNGVVTELGFAAGDTVTKGDVLFELDDTVARAQLWTSERKLVLEKANYDAIAVLANERLVTADQLDQAEESYLSAEVSVITNRSTLDQFKVIAPFDGALGIPQVDVGTFISTGAELVDLVNRSELLIDFAISERLLSSLALGQTFDATFEAVPGKTFTGTVLAILPSAASGNASIQLRGGIDNADLVLLPGLFARIELAVATRADAVMVPSAAVVKGLGGNYVFTVVNGKAKRISVETGVVQGDLIEITKGVVATDTVVTMGMDKLADGSSVKEATGS